MPYSIKICIDNKGLKSITDAGQVVTLAKGVDASVIGAAAANSRAIAWLSFAPFGTNLVSWDANYYLYATTTAMVPGAVIAINSMTQVPAQPGYLYTFQDGVFGTPSSGSGSNYRVSNQMSTGNLGFGLAQQATVNNGAMAAAPLAAIPALYNETATFVAREQVFVFLSSYGSNGTVMSQPPANPLVTLSSRQPTAHVGFDDSTNSFFLKS